MSEILTAAAYRKTLKPARQNKNHKNKMKKIKIQFAHWKCKGIYKRFKSSYSSIRQKVPQLNAGAIFRATLHHNQSVFWLKDSDGYTHEIDDVLPATKQERNRWDVLQKAIQQQKESLINQ